MKKSKIIAYLLFLMFSFSSVAALADPIELYDRDSSISGTDLVTFSAKINDYVIIPPSTDPESFVTSPTSRLTDNDLLSGSYTRGYPVSDYSWLIPSENTYAKSTIDFTNGSIFSQINYGLNYNTSNDYYFSRINIFTKNLPSSYLLSGTGSYSNLFALTVYNNNNTSLGMINLTSQDSNNYRLVVSKDGNNEFYTDGTSTYDWSHWISSALAPDQDDLETFVDWIVPDQTTDFYFRISAAAGSYDRDFGNASTIINFGDSTPVPEPSTLFLLGAGLGGMTLWRRKFTKR